MLHKYLRWFLTGLIGLVMTTQTSAETLVTGNVSTSATWSATGNPWIITSSDINNPIQEINIGASVTLTIEPGVVIEVDGPISIKVLGTLIARGTVNSPITIREHTPGGQWRTLEFANSSTDAIFNNGVYQSGSILEYVNIVSGGGLSYSKQNANGSIYLNSARPYINQVTISDGDASGIYAYEIDGLLKIDNSTITNNHDTSIDKAGGITLRNQVAIGANIQITNSTVSDNSTNSVLGGGGIAVENIEALLLSGNTIADNVSATLGGGVVLFNLTGTQTSYQITGNTIAGNIAETRGGGLVVENSNVLVRDNLIEDNITNSSAGGGVNILIDSNVELDGNVIRNNNAATLGGGVYVAPDSSINTIIPGININVINNVFSANHAATRAGGLFVEKETITVTDNVFADNTADVSNAAIEVRSGGTLARNSIVRNQANIIMTVDDAYDPESLGLTTAMIVQDNSIVNNVSGLYVVHNASGEATGQLAVVNANNILDNGVGFYLANTVSLPGDMMAENNYFGTADVMVLQPNMEGFVDFDPPAVAMFTDPAPIAPPVNVTMTRSGSSVTLSWSVSPEIDVTGYTVYWGNSQAPGYEQQLDVGMATSHTITGLSSSQNWYFAVTAYDTDFGTVTDDPATIVNERQTAGHESWFSEEFMIAATLSSGGGGSGGGGSMGWILMLLIPVYLRRTQPIMSRRTTPI